MLEETLIEWRKKMLREADRNAREARRKALQEGRKEGRQEGRQEGRREGRRDSLLQVLTLRFGPLPEDVQSRVEKIESAQVLNRLMRKALSAKSLDEVFHPLQARPRVRKQSS